MTVIAWDGKTLAADKRASKLGMVFTVTKIFRVGDRLMGIAGDAGRGLQLIEWLRNGGDPEKYPGQTDKDDDDPAHILCIEKGGRILLYERAVPIVVEDRLFAEGDGREFAMAAMHTGMDAAAAVAFASRFMHACGNGVDTLTFDPEQ